MDIFAVCKVAGIGCSIVGGMLGAVGTIPEFKSAMNEAFKKENDEPNLEDDVTITEL